MGTTPLCTITTVFLSYPRLYICFGISWPLSLCYRDGNAEYGAVGLGGILPVVLDVILGSTVAHASVVVEVVVNISL